MSERGIRKTKVCIVVSDKMDKTIVVQIVRKAKHPLYGKTVKITKKMVTERLSPVIESEDLSRFIL